MAEKDRKNILNVPGKYYVDANCIACNACVAEAPNVFQIDDDEGYAYVVHQPKNKEEEEEVKNAIITCPTGAIGDDGISAK